MSIYDMVAFSGEGTVLSKYKPEKQNRTGYQSEEKLEESFIKQLEKQGYEYLKIDSEEDLINNLRLQLEKLNDIKFTDKEWKRFFNEIIAKESLTITDKTRLIQQDNIQNLKRDNGTIVNIRLIDKKNIHKNSLQVINQYIQDKGTRENRYDVTILVNGLPLVHTELKRRGVNIKEAFNQIDRYQRESFWSGHGLFEYVQIFVISNGTETKYYSNTTRDRAIKERKEKRGKGKKTSNSFEFTSYWADANNNVITDLVDFTKTFFSRHSILNILTRYCILDSDNVLLVMRPYQIRATEQIINRIIQAQYYKWAGKKEAGGFIWHTTGSGKTLTSFKTSQLATEIENIDKVLFIVDRRDLDYQTQKEYDRFEEGSADGNVSTAKLKKQLEDPNSKIIITTIQKLNTFVKNNKNHPVYNKEVVMIFDECHRSQAGDMRANITKKFKKDYSFGFTGTPIFAENLSGNKISELTTENIFGDNLHTYTIVNAISDHNVLPFSIDTVDTVKLKEGILDEQISGIDREKIFMSEERINGIARYILDNFDRKTKRNGTYPDNERKRKAGFNSLFAVSSIPMAKRYYNAFKELQKDSKDPLRIATIFSFSPNEEDPSRSINPNGFLDDESFETKGLDQTSRDFLEEAINDYNKIFDTNFDTSSKSFGNYYQDLTRRIKDREVDMVIVVNMLLTGFDATTLNTLWVDKNLKMHGLIQAFSRTNRILNSVKSFGNIVTFRDLKDEVDEALRIFGDKDAHSIVILKSYDDYYHGYEENGSRHQGYKDIVADLTSQFPDPHIPEIKNSDKKEFAHIFGKLLQIMNILSTFEKFDDEKLISEADFQDYMSSYHRIREEVVSSRGNAENVNDDLVFEIELASSIEVDIDYILRLIEEYYKSGKKDIKLRDQINRHIDSSIKLRSKKELINNFIDKVNSDKEVSKEWTSFLEQEKEKELDRIIDEEKLNDENTRKFMSNCLRDGILKETGKELSSIINAPRFGGINKHVQKKKRALEKLRIFFDRFSGMLSFE